ncbi:hypothetical protein D3C72_1689660 [compost metagenome]
MPTATTRIRNAQAPTAEARAGHGLGGLIERGDGQLIAVGSCWPARAGVGHTLTSTVRAGHGARHRIERHNPEFVAVLGRAGMPRIGDTEHSLPRRLHADDGAGCVFHAHDAELAVLRGSGRRARIRDRECARHGPGIAGDRARRAVPLAHAQHTAVHFGHDQEIPQLPALDRQPVQAAPVAPGFDEGQPHPGFPAQVRDAMHGAGA